MRHLNNGTDHRHSKSCCDQSSPARRTITPRFRFAETITSLFAQQHEVRAQFPPYFCHLSYIQYNDICTWFYCALFYCGYIISFYWIRVILSHERHYSDVIMSPIASEITNVSIVCLAVCSGANQRKHQSSAPLAFVRGIHRWPVNSPHKGPVTRKSFPFDDVIM